MILGIEKINNGISKIWNEKTIRIGKILLYSFIVLFTIKALVQYETVYTQAEMDVYFWSACCGIAALVFLCKKVNPINWQSGLATVVLVLCCIWYALPFQKSPSILATIRWNGLTLWLISMIVIDMALHRNYVRFEEYRIWPLILYVTAAFLVQYNRMGRKEMIILTVPFLFFFTIQFTKEEWKDFLIAFCIGWGLAFVWVIWNSLVENPELKGDRWYGMFPTLATFGFFLNCVMLIGIFVIACSRHKIKNPAVWVSLGGLIATFWVWTYTGTRTTLFMLAVVLVVLFLCKRKLSWKTYVAFAILLTIVIVCCVAGYNYISSFSEEELRSYMSEYIELHGNGTMSYLLAHILTPFYDTVKESNPYFTGFAAMLDAFSARRLTIAKAFLEAVSFTPNGLEGVYIDEYYPGHAHNTYIQMAYQFGIPTAVFYISFFFYGFIDRFRAYKKNHEAYNLLPVLWLAMMLTTWITETVIICSAMTIMGLITMYPFVVKLDD